MATDVCAVTYFFKPEEGVPFRSFEEISRQHMDSGFLRDDTSRGGMVELMIRHFAKVFEIEGLAFFDAELTVFDLGQLAVALAAVERLLSALAERPQVILEAGFNFGLSEEEVIEAVAMNNEALFNHMNHDDGDDIYSTLRRLDSYRLRFQTALQRGQHILMIVGP